MKSKILTIALGTVMTACSATAANDSYTVTADVPAEFNGKTAFIVNFDTGEKIDSVAVANGTATFKGEIAKPVTARLIVDGNRAGTFILESGDIKIADRNATGSKLNDLNASIMNQVQQRFMAPFQALPQDSTADAARQKILDSYNQFTDSVFNANIDNPIGYTIFLEKAYDMSLPELKKFLNAHPSLKAYKRVNTIVEAGEKKAATQPGRKFVDFTVKNDTLTQSLSDYVGKGKPVLVDFWASWCGPCRREMPNLVEAYAKYKNKNFEIVGVSLDQSADAWKEAIKKLNITWPQMSDLKYWNCEGAQLYAVSSIPHTVLIDGEGTILARGLHGDELQEKIAEAVK